MEKMISVKPTLLQHSVTDISVSYVLVVSPGSQV